MKFRIIIPLLLLLPTLALAQQQKQPYSRIDQDLVAFENEEIDSLKDQLRLAKADTLRITILENLGFAYQRTNNDSSWKYGLASLELARKGGYVKREARALAGLSGVLREQGKFDEALDVLFQALKLAEENNIPLEIARCHRRLGAVYRELENYPKALEYHKQALKKDKAINNSNGISLDHMDLANIYERLDQLDSALYHAEIALKLMDVGAGLRPVVLLILGNIYFKKENYTLASTYYHDGLKRCIQTNDYGTSARICYDLAQMFKKLNRSDSAIFYASLGFESGKKSSYKKGIIQNGIILAGLIETIRPDVALQYYKIAYATKDSLFGPDNIETMQNLISREEDRQRELAAAKIAYRNSLRWYGVLLGLGALSILAFILYRNNRQKQKANVLLFQQKEEIQNTLTQLKSTQRQLIQSEKMASLGELTAGIAHEIQNPLNFVNNFSEVSAELIKDMTDEVGKGNLLEVKALANDVAQNLEKINHHGKRASEIVKGMLQHSRSNSGHKELTDLNALCDEYLRLSYQGQRAKDKSFNVKFETFLDDSIPKMEVIPQDIGRTVLNLINNAFYAVNEKAKQGITNYEPTVSISTKKENDHVLISVIDNGNGIPDSIKEKIFQPFFTTKPTGQGTGLGLSLSYDIVKAHGGSITVVSNYSEPGSITVNSKYGPPVREIKLKSTKNVGTEFIINLPLK